MHRILGCVSTKWVDTRLMLSVRRSECIEAWNRRCKSLKYPSIQFATRITQGKRIEIYKEILPTNHGRTRYSEIIQCIDILF